MRSSPGDSTRCRQPAQARAPGPRHDPCSLLFVPRASSIESPRRASAVDRRLPASWSAVEGCRDRSGPRSVPSDYPRGAEGAAPRHRRGAESNVNRPELVDVRQRADRHESTRWHAAPAGHRSGDRAAALRPGGSRCPAASLDRSRDDRPPHGRARRLEAGDTPTIERLGNDRPRPYGSRAIELAATSRPGRRSTHSCRRRTDAPGAEASRRLDAH